MIQVADKSSNTALGELVSIVEQQWPGLGPHAIVNVFGEHDDLVLGDRHVRWVPPESIQDETGIRVVLAKQAISTGWDCPRAEVLYSERPAKDATHIAQIIGRMVRSPLARRITTDDALNTVSCCLPRFNRAALEAVTDELTKPGEPGAASDVTINAQLFERNERVAQEVFEFVESLPSWPKPDSLANPLRRAKSLVKLLTDDSDGVALLPDAGRSLADLLNKKLDGLAAERSSEVAANVEALETAQIKTTSVTHTGQQLSTATRTIPTATRDIDRDTRRIVNSLKEGVGNDYVRYRVASAGDNADVLSIRTEVAALIELDGVREAIEDTATKWGRDQFWAFAVEIKNTTGAKKDAFLKVKEQTSDREQNELELPTTLKAPTLSSNKSDAEHLPRFESHLFSDDSGCFPAKLNTWEKHVIETELARPSFVAWYRNPSRAGSTALRVGYMKDNEDWGSLQPDFIIISRESDGSLGASIVDPHGDHLADAKAKLRGLAEFAEQFADYFIRVESIARVGESSLRSLDLLNKHVRAAVRSFEGGKVTALYESDVADDYR